MKICIVQKLELNIHSSRLFIYNHKFIPFQEVRNLIFPATKRKAEQMLGFFYFNSISSKKSSARKPCSPQNA